MKKKYFYFANPHTFKYPLYIRILFKMSNNRIIHRKDYSKWKEEENYIYYGEPVNCIIPEKPLAYRFAFSLLNSEISDNIFGAINYMLRNHRKRFLTDISSLQKHCVGEDILIRFFDEDIHSTGDGSKTGDGSLS